MTFGRTCLAHPRNLLLPLLAALACDEPTRPHASLTRSRGSLNVTDPSACVQHPPGLVAYWPAEENADDVVGGRNGQAEGSVSFVGGKVGRAFRFDGGSQITVPDDPAWTFGMNPFTVELWVSFDLIQGRDAFIGHDEGGGTTNKWIFWFDQWGHLGTPGNKLRLHLNTTDNGMTDPVEGDWSPVIGKWYHVALTRDGETHSLYLDGVQIATSTSSMAFPDPSNVLTIGGAEDFRFVGKIDEVAIYNRALTTAEVKAVHDAARPAECATNNAPRAVIDSPEYVAPAFKSVPFSSNGSSDPDGDVLQYAWDFGDGEISSEQNPFHSYRAAGRYTVTLRVSDAFATSVATAVAVIQPPMESGSCVAPPSGLVSWWRAEGDFSDATGGNPGTRLGGVRHAPGRVGQAFLFDGLTGDVSVGVRPNLDVGRGDGFTYEAWISPMGTAVDVPGAGPVLEYADGVHVWQWDEGAPFSGFLGHIGSSTGYFVRANEGLAQNSWSHIAFTYSTLTGEATLYHDGALAAQATGPSRADFASFVTWTEFHIGRRPPGSYGSGGQTFNGMIDEVSVYNRVLTKPEIWSIFHAGGSGKCAPNVNREPVVDIGGPYSGSEGSPVAFDKVAASDPDGDPLTFAWDFGDGSPREPGQSVSHVYADDHPAGSSSGTPFVVTLTVSDGKSNTTVQTTATVSNVAPTATLTAPSTADEGRSFVIALSDARDASAADVTTGFTYAFDCGNGWAALETTSQRSCTVDDDRTVTVKAAIFDKDGGTTQYSATVTVRNVAPAATFTYSPSVDEGGAMQLQLSAQQDAPADVGSLHYAFDCGAGYGTALDYASASSNATKACPEPDGPSTRVVRAKVFDKDGAASEYVSTAPIPIYNLPPTRVTVWMANASLVKGKVVVDARASFEDPGVSDGPWAYDFDWGDGTARTTGSVASQTAGINATHEYATGGAYTITVTVRDKDAAATALNKGSSGVGTTTIDLTGSGSGGGTVARWTVESSGVSAKLQDVWAAANGNAFAVGDAGTILRYDGQRWAPMSWQPTQGSATTVTLYDVWGRSPTDVWATGSGVILHFNGVAWTEAFRLTSSIPIHGIWGSPTGNKMFAVGAAGTLVESNNRGATWTQVASTPFGPRTMHSVWGSSDTDVWAVGDGIVSRYVYESKSKSYKWTQQTDRNVNLTGTNLEVWGTLRLSGSGAGSEFDVYVVGAGGSISRLSSRGWSAPPSGTTRSLHGVWGSQPTSATPPDIFAVGAGGTIVRSSDGGLTWAPMANQASVDLFGVSGSSSSSAVAVGMNGVVVRGGP